MAPVRVGMIGISEGNGHPFSFSAIINGYSDEGLAQSGWPGIYEYVRRRDPSELGVQNLVVTHAWTQSRKVTADLCRACNIDHAARSYEDMLGNIDALVIARDDYETHLELARPFLEAGLPVFVDKPLAVDLEELRYFKPYLETGKLMSCSGMRYARELDEVRAALRDQDGLALLRGAIVNSWEKYGVHLIDALLGVTKARPVSVVALEASHCSMAVSMDDGSLMQIDTLGSISGCFRIDVWSSGHVSSCEITDNFSMFRRMLWHFAEMVRSGRPQVPVADTLDSMRLLMAGRTSRTTGRKVLLSEIQI